MADAHGNSVLGQVMHLERFSDLKFVCKGEEFKVHKAIVCAQSPVILAAHKEGFVEAETNVISMQDFELFAVKRLVQFLYTGDYSDFGNSDLPTSPTSAVDTSSSNTGQTSEDMVVFPTPPSSDNERGSTGPAGTTAAMVQPAGWNTGDTLLAHARVNSIGDYYGIPKLVVLANEKVQQLLWSDATDLFWMPSLPTAVDLAANSTGDSGLLKVLAQVTAHNLSDMLEYADFESLDSMTTFALKFLVTAPLR